MKTAVILSYKGLGANLLHLTYCHEIAKKFGPITIITLCKNLEEALSEDPLIKEITKDEIIQKYNSSLKVITKNSSQYFDREILKLSNVNIVTLEHKELEFLRLRDLLEKNLVRPIYLS